MTLRISDVIPLHLADVVYPDSHPLAGEVGPVYGFSIRHSAGVLIVDTGIGDPNPEVDAHYHPQRKSLKSELGRAGVPLSDVTAVVNTHLHFDHCGQNRVFPGVPIFVQPAEYEAAQAHDYTVTEWVQFPGADYRLRSGDFEVARRIRVLATPGHTSGHQSVGVETDDGLVLIAGHAIFSAREFAGAAPPQETSEVARASAARLRELDPERVFFSHDGRPWDRP